MLRGLLLAALVGGGGLTLGLGSGVGSGVGNAAAPTYCGRKCNCGTGTGATIETDAGERVAGYTPPSGEHCACAEVYRCDAKSAGAPDQQSYCSLPGWGNGIYLTTPAVGSGGL